MAAVKRGTLVIFRLTSFLLLFTFNSCDLIYSPVSENFVNISPPNAKMSINLATAGDTVFVNGEVDIHYSVDTQGKTLSHLNVFIDSTLSAVTENPTSFTFHSSNYSDGLHKLSLEAWVNSGNGSLADRLNNEFLVSRRVWYVSIDNHSFLNKFQIDSVYCDNGALTVKWPRYPYTNFVSYTLYKAVYDANGNLGGFNKYFTTGNKAVCTYTDTFYMGGPVKYYVAIKTDHELYASPEKLFNDSASSILSISKLDDDSVKIVISKVKYYRNIKKISISKAYESGYSWTPISTTSLNDTVFHDAPGFGIGLNYSIIYYGIYGQQAQSALKTYYQGTQIPYFDGMQYIPQTNSYYFFYQTRTERWDASSMSFIAQGIGKILVSSLGSFAFANNYNRFWDPYPHSVTRVDPLTLQKIGNTLITDYYTGYYSTDDKFAVSESGLLAYLSFRYDGGSDLQGPPATMIFDPDIPGVIAKDSTASYYNYEFPISKLTDEGEYFIPSSSRYIYNLTGRTLKKISSTAPWPACFTPSGKEFVVPTTYPSGFAIYSCKNGSLIKSFTIPDDLSNLSVDPVSGYLGAYISSIQKYRIYNLNNGKLVKEILLPYRATYYTYFYLYNSTLFSTRGYYLKLSLNKKERY